MHVLSLSLHILNTNVGGLVAQPTANYSSGNFDLVVAMISHFSYFPILPVCQKELPRKFSSFSLTAYS